MEERKCKVCCKLFLPKKWNHIFCSAVCKDKSRVSKRKCKGCGIVFMPSLHHKIFCSRPCKDKFSISDRECYDCGKISPSTEFSKRSYTCKKCVSVKSLANYKLNRNHRLRYARKYYQEHQEELRKYDIKRRLKLTDSVVRDMLVCQGFPKYMITHRRIELKRQQVILYRLLGRKKKKKEPSLKERKVTRKCKECGSDFFIKSYKSVYCSKKCSNEKKKQSYYNPNGVGSVQLCVECNKEFVRIYNEKYCSNRCVGISKKETSRISARKERKTIKGKARKAEENSMAYARLADWVVRAKLKRSGFPEATITPELIELKREHIKLYRLINKKQKDEKFRIV